MKLISFILMLSCLCACGATPKKNNTVQVHVADVKFSADSAYHFVQTQVNFGYRVPNTQAHKACANYLAETLTQFGAQVTKQEATLEAYNGTLLEAINIIGSYNVDNPNRILLCAHWDTRPYSDYDPNPENHQKPLLGANDGASGVGVLLEIARQLSIKMPNIGVDIIFFDAEDYGTPEFYKGIQKEHTWCLGSQYWAKHPHVKEYKAQYGILLDMVGAPDAVFPKEYFSMQYASHIVENVWNTAQSLGFGELFINKKAYPITDDHYYINTLAGIPCIDIIHYRQGSEKGFADYWHTQNDNMQNISKNTLYAVGKTIMTVLFQ